MTLQEYLTRSIKFRDDKPTPLFRFDNYLSAHLDVFGDEVTKFYCATHERGDTPAMPFTKVEVYDLPFSILESNAAPWIMNIDLDYFFCPLPGKDTRQFLDDEYIHSVFKEVKERIDDKSIAVTTIAISPETCGGWMHGERVLKVALNALGIQFQLP